MTGIDSRSEGADVYWGAVSVNAHLQQESLVVNFFH